MSAHRDAWACLAGLMLVTTWPSIGGDGPARERVDFRADTWVATDGLGRRVPTFDDVGPPRSDRTVGIFYFLWHGEHIQGGPYDVSRILADHPDAMERPNLAAWGPLHAPHHWGESIFGYYLTDDEGVLRKHAQMLSDAGVDVVIFDVTNQVTYPRWYRALLRVWGAMREAGNPTPQVAFLTPFWDPAKVVDELWRDLYQPGLHPELWFHWEGRPLILADPGLLDRRFDQAAQDTPVEIEPGMALGQSFQSETAFRGVGGRFPTWRTGDASITLTLFRKGPGGERLVAERFHHVGDNDWLILQSKSAFPPGAYYLEASEPGGRIGWWSHSSNRLESGSAFRQGTEVSGDRTLRLIFVDDDVDRIRSFFTFRKPQPDYFQGPTRSDMWSWLEVYPQHVFRNARGEKEQMSVGVAQNAVGDRLGSMSEPGARGRSFHGGTSDQRPDAVRLGLNVAEQWDRALREDPRFIFVTGWNEWIAGRFAEFNRVRLPVMFVDQFDQEHSRDIEPMRGGHGDDYYYQLVDRIRRYKGVRALPRVIPQPIRLDGVFEDWRSVEPEYRDTVGDPVHRDHRGWDAQVVYRNASGRHDLVASKVSFDSEHLYLLARAREPLRLPEPRSATRWMLLFLDVDADPGTGWLGYDFVVNRVVGARSGSIERHRGPGYAWEVIGEVPVHAQGTRLEVGIPWKALGCATVPAQVDFKWADHIGETGDWSDFTLNGDVAPNDRFNYRAVLADVAGRTSP